MLNANFSGSWYFRYSSDAKMARRISSVTGLTTPLASEIPLENTGSVGTRLHCRFTLSRTMFLLAVGGLPVIRPPSWAEVFIRPSAQPVTMHRWVSVYVHRLSLRKSVFPDWLRVGSLTCNYYFYALDSKDPESRNMKLKSKLGIARGPVLHQRKQSFCDRIETLYNDRNSLAPS